MVNAITDNGYFYVLLVFTAAFAIVSIAAYFSKKHSNEYDERQTVSRGIAYRYSFWVIIAYFTAAAFASRMGFPFLISVPGIYIGIFIALTVFAEVCVFKDAYFTLNEKPLTYIIISGICFIGFAAWGVRSVLIGGTDNEIGISFTIAAFFLILLVSLLIRVAYNKKTEHMQEDGYEES